MGCKHSTGSYDVVSSHFLLKQSREVLFVASKPCSYADSHETVHLCCVRPNVVNTTATSSNADHFSDHFSVMCYSTSHRVVFVVVVTLGLVG